MERVKFKKNEIARTIYRDKLVKVLETIERYGRLWNRCLTEEGNIEMLAPSELIKIKFEKNKGGLK